MGARVLLFEPRARVLERVSDMLRRTGTELTDCYSEAKFRHTVKQCALFDHVIVCPERFVSVAREISPAGAVVPYPSDCVFEELESEAPRRLVEAVKRLERTHARRGRSAEPLELLVIGSSTGGFPVVQQILRSISPSRTIVVIAQHIGLGMTEDLSRIACKRADVTTVHGRTRLKPGGVYMLAGGKDFAFDRQGGSLLLRGATGDGYHYHPSVTLLFNSVAALGSNSDIACMVLSGLGDDGATSLPALQSTGILTLAQDPRTAKAPGMPTAAVTSGAITHVYPVTQLESFVQRRVK